MNLCTLYLLLLKATVTSFSGLTSLPVIHHDLVVERRLLSDRDLSAAVAAGRAGPGPYGLYVVSVGYLVAGVPGAAVGLLALMTPAFLIIPMARYLGPKARQPRVRAAIEGVLASAAGLLIVSTVPLARESVRDPSSVAIAAVSFLVLTATRLDVGWAMLGAAAAGMLLAAL
ncbi:MAG: chromate transporter [Bryobacterales bacterium]|nr:chromate transporter [Bryobacteraceae bacterium]MDW8129148.1 chromate transporter [Bryobacterales bacterium]